MTDKNPVTTSHTADPLDITNEPEFNTPDSIVGLPKRNPIRRVLEPAAMGIMALGALMMFQPFAKILFTYSFIVILFGTLMFIIVTKFPE